MTVTIRLFAAAAEVVGAHEVSLDATGLDLRTVADVRAALGAMGSDAGHQDSAAVIRQCAILEAGVRRDDDHVLAAGTQIDVMPPFAGG